MNLIALATATARARKGFDSYLWNTLAYAGRYGHQPLDVLYEMTIADLTKFVRALSEIVREENKPKQQEV